MWRHIDAIKEGRVVLLTTHAMEEADLLADSVAVSQDLVWHNGFWLEGTSTNVEMRDMPFYRLCVKANLLLLVRLWS